MNRSTEVFIFIILLALVLFWANKTSVGNSLLSLRASGEQTGLRGDIVLDGGANLAWLQNSSNNTLTLSLNAVSGTATIVGGQTEVTVNHQFGFPLQIEPDRIFITPTTSTQGQIPYVSAKSATTFTISIDSSVVNDIVFDWLAILDW